YFPYWSYRWPSDLCRQFHETLTPLGDRGACQHGQSLRAPPGHFREGPVEIVRPARLDDLKPHPESLRRNFRSRQQGFPLGFAESRWLPENSDSTDSRNDLREQLHGFAD